MSALEKSLEELKQKVVSFMDAALTFDASAQKELLKEILSFTEVLIIIIVVIVLFIIVVV